MGLFYGKCKSDQGIKIYSYSDADFAGDDRTRKSTSGCIVKLGHDLITWSSRKQPSVALSTTESEFIAACNTVQEIIWVHRLITDLIGDKLQKISTLYVDNQSAIKLIKNPQFHCKTKHIDIKYKFIREKYRTNLFDLHYICSKDQEADILTKALPRETFQRLRNQIGVDAFSKWEC